MSNVQNSEINPTPQLTNPTVLLSNEIIKSDLQLSQFFSNQIEPNSKTIDIIPCQDATVQQLTSANSSKRYFNVPFGVNQPNYFSNIKNNTLNIVINMSFITTASSATDPAFMVAVYFKDMSQLFNVITLSVNNTPVLNSINHRLEQDIYNCMWKNPNFNSPKDVYYKKFSTSSVCYLIHPANTATQQHSVQFSASIKLKHLDVFFKTLKPKYITSYNGLFNLRLEFTNFDQALVFTPIYFSRDSVVLTDPLNISSVTTPTSNIIQTPYITLYPLTQRNIVSIQLTAEGESLYKYGTVSLTGYQFKRADMTFISYKLNNAGQTYLDQFYQSRKMLIFYAKHFDSVNFDNNNPVQKYKLMTINKQVQNCEACFISNATYDYNDVIFDHPLYTDTKLIVNKQMIPNYNMLSVGGLNETQLTLSLFGDIYKNNKLLKEYIFNKGYIENSLTGQDLGNDVTRYGTQNDYDSMILILADERNKKINSCSFHFPYKISYNEDFGTGISYQAKNVVNFQFSAVVLDNNTEIKKNFGVDSNSLRIGFDHPPFQGVGASNYGHWSPSSMLTTLEERQYYGRLDNTRLIEVGEISN